VSCVDPIVIAARFEILAFPITRDLFSLGFELLALGALLVRRAVVVGRQSVRFTVPFVSLTALEHRPPAVFRRRSSSQRFIP
jgi:hypothetical protein